MVQLSLTAKERRLSVCYTLFDCACEVHRWHSCSSLALATASMLPRVFDCAQGFLKKSLADKIAAAMVAEDAADEVGGGQVPAYEVCACVRVLLHACLLHKKKHRSTHRVIQTNMRAHIRTEHFTHLTI